MSWASRNNDPKRKLGAKQHKVTLDVMEGLRGLMKRKNVKQTDLAGRLGKTRAWISKLLHGGQNVTLFTVVEMADALGFDVRVDFVPH
jgi:transcriptional regulator with XRE-family HTH domain